MAHPCRLAVFMHEEEMIYEKDKDYMQRKHDWLVHAKERVNQKSNRHRGQLVNLAESFRNMMMKGQWTRLSHLTHWDGAHPLSCEYVKSQHLLAWHNACNNMHEGKRPDYPCAVRLGNDKKSAPVLELDEEGQIVKPDPYEPEGSVIGKRKRQALD